MSAVAQLLIETLHGWAGVKIVLSIKNVVVVMRVVRALRNCNAAAVLYIGRSEMQTSLHIVTSDCRRAQPGGCSSVQKLAMVVYRRGDECVDRVQLVVVLTVQTAGRFLSVHNATGFKY